MNHMSVTNIAVAKRENTFQEIFFSLKWNMKRGKKPFLRKNLAEIAEYKVYILKLLCLLSKTIIPLI